MVLGIKEVERDSKLLAVPTSPQWPQEIQEPVSLMLLAQKPGLTREGACLANQ